MRAPTEQELKEFCQRAGVHWHEIDKKTLKSSISPNPTLSGGRMMNF